MSALKWIVANWDSLIEIAGAIGAAASLIVAKLPQSASKNSAIAVLERVSVLTHKDSPGTLKLPGTTAIVEPTAVVAPSVDGTNAR